MRSEPSVQNPPLIRRESTGEVGTGTDGTKIVPIGQFCSLLAESPAVKRDTRKGVHSHRHAEFVGVKSRISAQAGCSGALASA